MSASIWNPGGVLKPQADPNSEVKSELFTASAGQTIFTLSQFTYVTNNGALQVFVNGVKQSSAVITELTNSSFSVPPCEAGDLVEVVGQTAIKDITGSAEAAAASAASAAISAASALVSENTAAAAATSASASATSALTAEANTVSLYDQFDDRYLGAKTAAPTADNDGNALQVGAMYLNSTDSNTYVWLASNTWASVSSVASSMAAAASAAAALLSEQHASASEVAAAGSAGLASNYAQLANIGDYGSVTAVSTLDSDYGAL